MPATEMDQPAEKRQRSDKPATSPAPLVSINPWYLTSDFAAPFREAFTSSLSSTYTHTSPSSDASGTIVAHPFHTAKLQNILPPAFLHALKQELTSLTWHERSNDLYTFHQTDDLALNPLTHIKALRDYLASDQFVTLMERLTGTQLARGHLDMAAQRYKKGNHLLCHDDDVHRGQMARRIAYIIYLVDEQWSEEDGGALGLYSNDSEGQPGEVVARLLPEFNSMGFFLTGLVSFHTVEEITVRDANRERWSVTGWFYGPTESLVAQEHPPLSPSLLPALLPFSEDSADWAQWVNPEYLSEKSQDRIQDMFLDQSSVQLQQFIAPDVYAQILAESDPWSTATLLGPPHLRSYLEATPAPASKLSALLAFLRSSSFARLLTKLTSIDTVAAAQQLRRFEHGHYTLIHDEVQEPFGLDVTLSLQPTKTEWEDSWGGATHYIADKDELLRITPEANSLSLVLRDEGTLRFVKFLNHMAPVSRQEVAMVFDIAPSDSDSDSDDEE